MKTSLALILSLLSASATFANVKVDAPAPPFSEKDALGKIHSLQDFKGKWVVLEWHNKGCPFVKKHYGSKNMQALQGEFTQKGVVWLSINSSAEGKEGYETPEEALATAKTSESKASAILMDTDGSMGKLYGAKTTPHMFVINPQGVVVYAGAIDNNDSAKPSVIPTSENYIKAALDAAMSGKSVAVKSSKPYGCSVKYN